MSKWLKENRSPRSSDILTSSKNVSIKYILKIDITRTWPNSQKPILGQSSFRVKSMKREMFCTKHHIKVVASLESKPLFITFKTLLRPPHSCSGFYVSFTHKFGGISQTSASSKCSPHIHRFVCEMLPCAKVTSILMLLI